MKEVLYIIKQEELDWIKGELHEIKSLVAEGKKKSNTRRKLSILSAPSIVKRA